MRKDIHRPGAINPGEYQFVGIWYDPQHIETVGGSQLMEQERENIRQFMEEHGARWANHEHGGTCQCCGAHALYLAAFYHEPHNEVIRVGQDCAHKLHMGCEDAFNAARRKVASAKEYATGKARARLQLEEKGLLNAWTLWEAKSRVDSDTEIVVDMVGKLISYGNLSDKQWEFLKRLLHRIENREDLEAQRAAEKAAAQDCPEGRLDIVGTVLTTKTVDEDGPYGPQFKMLIKAPEGYTLWGTVPAGLQPERGQEVAFRATVKPSEKDPKHGYYSRPKVCKAA